jgi:hypothetical protein
MGYGSNRSISCNCFSVRWTVVKRRRDGEMYDGMHSVLTNSLCPKVSANTSRCSRLTGFKMSVIICSLGLAETVRAEFFAEVRDSTEK